MGYVGFKNLKESLAKSGKVRNPGAVAASIGRKKYGDAKFNRAASSGTKMRGMKPAAQSTPRAKSAPKAAKAPRANGKGRS